MLKLEPIKEILRINYEETSMVKIEARGVKKFFKFYKMLCTEEYVVSKKNNAILDLAELSIE